MAESNGGGRFDDHAERLAKLEAARKEIEDASLVMSVLESKSASRIKEHAQFIATMEAGMRSHELRIAKQEETSDLLGQRVHALVSAIGDLISHIPPAAQLARSRIRIDRLLYPYKYSFGRTHSSL